MTILKTDSEIWVYLWEDKPKEIWMYNDCELDNIIKVIKERINRLVFAVKQIFG